MLRPHYEASGTNGAYRVRYCRRAVSVLPERTMLVLTESMYGAIGLCAWHYNAIGLCTCSAMSGSDMR
eukprot:1103431-Rhodomonas_salina.1